MKKADILITGGQVIDPRNNTDCIMPVAMAGDRIIDAAGITAQDVEQVIDAQGCYVFPGLIDFHTHLFEGGSAISVAPDITLLPNGITTAVDAGTCGWSNIDVFHKTIVCNSHMRIFCYLNISHAGQVTLGGSSGYPEKINGAYINGPEIARALERYPQMILGLKIRFGKELYDADDSPLTQTLSLAENLRQPICIHVPNSLLEMPAIANRLRPGDVFAHCYHNIGPTILDGAGSVHPEIAAAQERGVLFDAAQGMGLFSFAIAGKAIEQGFYPDIISSDITRMSAWKPGIMFSLNFIMSKYLNMGLPLFEIIRAVTSTPAGVIGQPDQLGTLGAGACADACIMRILEKDTAFYDKEGAFITGNKLLKNMLTISRGRVVFRQIDF